MSEDLSAQNKATFGERFKILLGLGDKEADESSAEQFFSRDEALNKMDSTLSTLSADELRRYTPAQRGISLLLAGAIFTGAAEIGESGTVQATSIEPNPENNVKPAVASVQSTKTAEAAERLETAKTVAKATHGRAELISLEDIEETKYNAEFLTEAKSFVQRNKEGHIRGEERTIQYKQFMESSFHRIAEARRSGASEGELQQLAEIMQAGLFDDNELVRAGEPEDIIRTAVKTGLVSREASKVVMEGLFQDGRNYKIDLDKLELTVNDGEKVSITNKAIIKQVIGKYPVDMPKDLSEGMIVEGVYDVEEKDPLTGKKIQGDRKLAEEMVDNYWPTILNNLEKQGVDVEAYGQEIREMYIESLVTGQEQAFTFDKIENTTYKLRESSFEKLRLITEIQAVITEYFGGKTEPRVTIVPEVYKETIRVNADYEIFGGRVSHEQLCRGNFLLIIEAGNFTVSIDKAMMDKIQANGIMIIFDRLDAVMPAALRGEEGVVIEPKPGEKLAPLKTRKDQDFGREDIKEKPRSFGGAQATVGLHPHGYASKDHTFSVGRTAEKRAKGQKGSKSHHNLPKAGGKDPHSGKQRRG